MAIVKHNDKVYIVENAIFAFAKLAEPTKKYQSDDTEYAINAIVDKQTARQWNALFSKQKAKDYSPEEFAKKFKIDAPFGDDDVYVLSIKKPCVKNGVELNPQYRPRAIVCFDGENVDITTSRLIANGSKGKVSVRVSSNDFGVFAQLQSVFMDGKDFIEYSANGSSVGSEFGVTNVRQEPTNQDMINNRKAAEAKQAKEQDHAVVDDADGFEDDAPF